jgi:hypothetical protein
MSTVMIAVAEMSFSEQIEAIQYARSNDDWFPANGGTEKPFRSRSGIRILYCWQPSTGRHAYLNCNTGMLMTDEEANLAMLCLE